MITIELLRYSDNGESTLGIMSLVTGPHREFLCYTLEDTHRDSKVYGETRIPAGKYPVELRTVGRFHQRYSKRYGKWHKGMLHLRHIPGFKYVLIHCGNHKGHTKGCLLTGGTANNNQMRKGGRAIPGFIGDSRKAYEHMYPAIAEHLQSGIPVQITIVDMGAGS